MSSAARLVKSLGARLRNADPELVSLKVAARAAIVLPAVFLLADKIIGRSQTTIFAAFGSFAMLVLADFTGPWRPRLTAYLALAGVGAVFIALGTLCSRDALLGAAVMAVVAFAVLFSGVISRYVVAGTASALLTFILAVNVPAPDSSIPDRLGGWVLASAAGISAAMLLWPARPRAELRAAAAQACTALADLLAATLSGDAPMLDARAAAATEALTALRQRYDATLDAVGSGEAPALLVDELDWLHSVALSAAGESDGTSLLAEQQDREGMTEVIAALRASAARLSGGDKRPALDRLEAVEESIT
jgi:hypothetical protein